MKKNELFISIIIPNFNGEEIIDECILNIENQKYKNYEIVFIDDNSNDSSIEILKKYKNIKLVKNTKNLGFSGSCSRGSKEATGDILLFLNTDAFLIDNKTLLEINNRFNANPNLNVLGFYQIDKTGNLEFKGSEIDLFFNVNSFNSGNVKNITMVGGACFATRKLVYDKIGGIDKDYYLYSEEADYMYRSLKSGYSTELSLIKVQHIGGASTKNEYNFSTNENKMYFRERNSLISMLKNFDAPTLLIVFPFWLIFFLLELIFFIATFRITYIKNYLNIVIYLLKNKKIILNKRKHNFQLFVTKDFKLITEGFIKLTNFKYEYILERGIPKLK